MTDEKELNDKREEAVRLADAALEFIPHGAEIDFDEIENGFDVDLTEIMDAFKETNG